MPTKRELFSIANKHDDDFLNAIIDENIIDKAIIYMNNNLDPSEVFDEELLIEWATSNGYRKEEK